MVSFPSLKVAISVCCKDVLLLPITKPLGQNYLLQKYSLGKLQRTVVSDFAIFAQKWLKTAPWKKVDSMVFANHPSVHGGELEGGGSMAINVNDR